MKYILLTDERHAIIINTIEPSEIGLFVCGLVFSLGEQMSLRNMIGLLLNNASGQPFRSELPFQAVHGALNDTRNKLDYPVAINRNPTSYADFDVYTMQRHWPDLARFLEWQQNAQREAGALTVGDTLEVHVDNFSKSEPLLRFLLPLERPPTETLDIVMKHPRNRQSEIDDLLMLACRSEDGHLRFKISQVVRSELGKYSRVLFGHLEWESTDEKLTICQTCLCLKIFDEVFFPTLDAEECLRQFEAYLPHERLLSLNTANDMMRRELAVYGRLEYLQGTLLPHVYGFHQVMILSTCAFTI